MEPPLRSHYWYTSLEVKRIRICPKVPQAHWLALLTQPQVEQVQFALQKLLPLQQGEE